MALSESFFRKFLESFLRVFSKGLLQDSFCCFSKQYLNILSPSRISLRLFLKVRKFRHEIIQIYFHKLPPRLQQLIQRLHLDIVHTFSIHFSTDSFKNISEKSSWSSRVPSWSPSEIRLETHLAIFLGKFHRLIIQRFFRKLFQGFQ